MLKFKGFMNQKLKEILKEIETEEKKLESTLNDLKKFL